MNSHTADLFMHYTHYYSSFAKKYINTCTEHGGPDGHSNLLQHRRVRLFHYYFVAFFFFGFPKNTYFDLNMNYGRLLPMQSMHLVMIKCVHTFRNFIRCNSAKIQNSNSVEIRMKIEIGNIISESSRRFSFWNLIRMEL